MAHYDADGAGAIHTIRIPANGPRAARESAKVSFEPEGDSLERF